MNPEVPQSVSGSAQRCRSVAHVLGWTVAVIGGAVLIGWMANLSVLKTVFPGMASMKPNTALGLILCGVSLTLLSGEKGSNRVRYLAVAVAAVAALLGALTLIEYLVDWDFRIDNVLFPDLAHAVETSRAGRMSPATALCLVFAGAALLIASQRRAIRLWQPIVAGLSAAVTGIGALSLVGYLVEAGLGYRLWNYTGTAVHTSTGLVLLGCALMALARSAGGLTWMLDRTSTAVFLGAVMLMIIAGGSAFSFAMQLRETGAWVSHTQEVLKASQQLTTDVASIENDLRGYVITGDKKLSERFDKAKERVAVSLGEVRSLTSDNPNQQRRLDQIEPLIAQRIDFADQTITARNQQGLAAAQQLVDSGTGSALTDNINLLLQRVQDEEYVLLEKRKNQSETASVTTFLLLPLGLFLSLTSLSLGVFLLNAGVGERTRAEQAAAGSEARLAGIVNSAMDAIISIDSGQKIVLFNAAAEKIFRCPANSVVGHPIDTLMPEPFRQGHQQHVQGFERTGVTSRSMGSLGTLRGLRADGEEFPIEASISQIEVGGQKFFTVILRDITERQLLDAERQKFVSLAENSLEFIGMCDLQGTPFFINEAGLRLVGLEDLEYALQMPVKEFFFPSDQAFITEEFLPKVQREGHGEVEIRFRHFTTLEAIWMIYNVFVLRDATGQPVAFATVSRNITERKQAEQLLRESEERLRLAQQVARVGTFDWNIQTGANRWTPELEAIYGLAPGGFAGTQRTWEELVHPEDRAEAARQVSLALEGKPLEAEWRVIWPDSTIHWLAGRAWVFRDAMGNPLRLIGVNIDITERKAAEEEIGQLNAELEQRVVTRTAELQAANKELEAFSYSVSHDLRAPLRAVDGFSQAVVEDYGPLLPEEGRRYLQTIRQSAQRMGELIDDLLTFSRLSRQPLITRPLDSGKLVRNVIEELSNQLNGRHVDFRIEDLPSCQADPALLKQVWINLLSNALKFTRKQESALVEIGCAREGGHNVFSVRDNGTGFDMKYSDKLFGVFQRFHRAEDFEGTGVGLAIVQRVIHRHGGRVWADAAVGQGATFYFTLSGETDHE